MKWQELMRRLADLANARGVEMTTVEGGSHTKITIGSARTTVPRHAEVNELTARGILRHVETALAGTESGNAE
ncbi:MAG: hypothetical protein HYR62_02180 [Actinobacteria bacterium]|nr:hypothetical protein [Actinomycetota bacterium]MBI3687288.1 hypothetical protein [Actinomycetota bacterium]